MAKPAPLPDPKCAQLAALAPFITEKARRLAAARLGMTDEKVALLIVKAINPHEKLTEAEEATLRGVHRDTLRKLKQDKQTKLRPI